MKLSISDLMDGCRDCLDLAHVIPSGDLLPALAEIAVRGVVHGFETDPDSGCVQLQCSIQVVYLRV